VADHSLATQANREGTPSAFALPPLPYGDDGLTPFLSRETLAIHHGKHQARYVDTLNRLISQQDTAAPSLEELIRVADKLGSRSLFNNAAQAWNHSFFWESMRRDASRPRGLLIEAIIFAFGSFDALGQQLIAEGTGHFGSGWVWLVAQADRLSLLSTHDAGTPIIDESVTPLLACDVWEHAYYLDYRQDRATWLTVWWDRLANWQFAEQQYQAALGHGEVWHYPASAA
jgi:Fe-Mn family superoxide dismutase